MRTFVNDFKGLRSTMKAVSRIRICWTTERRWVATAPIRAAAKGQVSKVKEAC